MTVVVVHNNKQPHAARILLHLSYITMKAYIYDGTAALHWYVRTITERWKKAVLADVHQLRLPPFIFRALREIHPDVSVRTWLKVNARQTLLSGPRCVLI